jgi:hypothetical protein
VPGKYEAMTVNERLFVAGLLDDFEHAVRDGDAVALGRILHAVELSDDDISGILKRVLRER